MRICILGNSGVGKSTLAKRLGQVLNIPVYHLDRELLTGNYERISHDKLLKKHQLIINKDKWIIDGNYHKISEVRFDRAEMIVFLNTSRFRALWRIIIRALTRGQDIDTVPKEADRRRLSKNFIRYVVRYNRREKVRWLKEISSKREIPLVILNHMSLDKMIEEVLRFIKEKQKEKNGS